VAEKQQQNSSENAGLFRFSEVLVYPERFTALYSPLSKGNRPEKNSGKTAGGQQDDCREITGRWTDFTTLTPGYSG
jgi:hypothetical protein